MTAAFLTGLGRAALALALGPLAVGVTKRVKARCQGRRGPPLLQGYYDLAKWIRKESVVSVHASPLFRATPYALVGSVAAAAAIVPVAGAGGPSIGDLFALAGLLALGRFLLALAGLEAGSAFGGMAASRETMIGALVEPGLILAFAAPAIAAGSTEPAAIAAARLAAGAPAAGLLLAAAGLLVVSIAETGRVPVDNPDTHLELTMVHEGMLLEWSGRHLALAHLAAAAKQVVLLSVFCALFLPGGGAFAWAAKVTALSALLGLVETANVKMRLFRVPEVLGAAFLLGLAGAFLVS